MVPRTRSNGFRRLCSRDLYDIRSRIILKAPNTPSNVLLKNGIIRLLKATTK